MDSKIRPWYQTKQGLIAILSVLSVIIHIIMLMSGFDSYADYILLFCYALGGVPLLAGLLQKVFKLEFGSDLLAGISIVTSLILGEHLAGVFVILMLSGGEALEQYALKRASRVLDLLADRVPQVANKIENGSSLKVPISDLKKSDLIELYPHTVCPVDGVVLEGESYMDESILTGEPFKIKKIKGSNIISGSLNAEGRLTISVSAEARESRYQKLAKVIEENASKQVPIKRLADKLGAWYTPLALIIAVIAWLYSGDPLRFLSVLVVATPCPLLIAIPVALIGSISSAASRGIIIRDPASLENLPLCSAIVFDKTGTLTYGSPKLVEIKTFSQINSDQALTIAASMENYSSHPLASTIINEAKSKKLPLLALDSVSEQAGKGLSAEIAGEYYEIAGRKSLSVIHPDLPEKKAGMECFLLKGSELLAYFRFEDVPKADSKQIIEHIKEQHKFHYVGILSGDKLAEVSSLAKSLGITDIKASLTPEEKQQEILKLKNSYKVIYVGDGINDAAAIQASSVGISFSTGSEVTAEVADIVILDSSLSNLDQTFHIAHSFRRIALQSAVGGMAASILGMLLAANGIITPLIGAITQEIIDIAAVGNSLRTSFLKKDI